MSRVEFKTYLKNSLISCLIDSFLLRHWLPCVGRYAHFLSRTWESRNVDCCHFNRKERLCFVDMVDNQKVLKQFSRPTSVTKRTLYGGETYGEDWAHIWPDHNARFRRSAIVRPVTFNMLSESVTGQLGNESGNVEPWGRISVIMYLHYYEEVNISIFHKNLFQSVT